MVSCFYEGMSVPAVARKFGMHHSTVHKIRRRHEAKNGKQVRVHKPKDVRVLNDKRPLTSVHARIGLRIGAYMAEHELNATSFGELISASRVRVRNMQVGAYELTIMEVIQLSDVLSIPYEELVLGRKGETPSVHS